MSNIINDNQKIMRTVQEACDELDRKEVQNSILRKQKEDAEYMAEITTKANEELVKEIRDLNYKTGLYGVSKKEVEPREYERVYVERREETCHECQCEKCMHEHEHHHEYECVKKDQDVNIRVPWLKEHKSLFGAIIGFVVILLLATGFTPSGDFWMAVQDQWIALIADIFRIVLVAIACFFIYRGIKK